MGLVFLLIAPSAASATTLPSTIKEDMTLTAAGNPYTGTSTIEPGATVKVEPGVKFEIYSLAVKGTLKVEGTAENPVLFTDSGESPSWCSISFESGSGASVIDHAELSYGGGCGGGVVKVNGGSSPTIKNSTFRKSTNSPVRVYDGGAPEIANNEFLSNSATAIYYRASGTQTGEINIHGNLIEGGSNGIDVESTSTGLVAGKTLGANTIVNTTGIAFRYQGSDIPGNITGNTLIENKQQYITIGGTVAHTSTWNDGGTPISSEGGVTVASGATLTITKGVLLRIYSLTVKGTLNVEGTAEEPVVFTERIGSPSWCSISFESGSGASVIDHAELSYGGGCGGGVVKVNGGTPTIRWSTIRKGSNYGIRVTAGSPKIEWNSFRGNSGGIQYTGGGNLLAPNNDWGCANGPKPAGCGDSVTSNVKWNPAVQLPELNAQCRGHESQCGEGADPVSLATGQLAYSHRDLLLTNKSGVPLELTRAYSSGSSTDTGFGPGWSQTAFASATELASGAVLILRQDGRQDLFYKTGEGAYKVPSGVTSTLAKVEGTFQLTTLENTVYRFDASGRIASITDDHGLKTTYGYDANGRLATITDPSAQTLTLSYNASNHITSVKDSTGREVKYTYSAAGDLATVTDALSGITEYTYDSEHRLKTIKDPRGNVILKNTYDAQGRIIEQRDGLENLWKLEYKEDETIITEPEGGKIAYGFDGQDRVVSETDQLGHTTTTNYDAFGNVDEIVQPGGAKWQFGHDGDGNLISVVDPEGGERSYEYDGQSRPTDFTDARGKAWSYEWSKANDLIRIVDPEEGEAVLTYNESGQPLTSTDPDKHKTDFSYDSRGNRLSSTDPLGHKITFEYNSRNYLSSKTAPGLKAESYERNALGDLLSRTTPEGNKTKYVYDTNGLPTQITDPGENVWKIEYNAMERPTVYKDPLEGQVKVAYNGNLKPTTITNRRGKETTYDYDLANQLTEVDGPEGEDWIYGYDSRGNQASVVDPREHETAYEYDLLNRMTEADEPLGTTTEYGYDANGELTSLTDPRGNMTSYAYDNLGRLVEVAQPLEKTETYTYDGVGDPLTKTTAAGTLEYGYDSANRLISIGSGESTLRSFGYDAADRLTSAVDGESHKLEIGHDNDSRVTSIKDGRGQSLTRAYNSRGKLTKQVDGRGTLEYGYDKLGRLTTLTDPQEKTLGFAYDQEGNLTEVTRPNAVITTNVYDDGGHLAETTTEESETILEALGYSYDAAGNRVSETNRLEEETTYAYDALNRLVEFNPPGEATTAYGYDKAGNRTEAGATTYSYNALNQLTSSSDGTTYSYDGAGRMTGKENGSEETTYEWDPLDQLDSVESGAETTSYAYDALGRLSERTSGSSAQITHYGDLTDLATYDTDAEGKTMISYVRGARGLVEQRSGEATSYPLADAHGDITAIVATGGGVTSRQTYDPWGTQLSGPALEMGYIGAQQRRADPATGLIQMGVRSYDARQGRFLTEDAVLGTIGMAQLSNRYAYVGDRTPNLIDLTGRYPLESVVEGGGEIVDSWAEDPLNFGDPRDLVIAAQKYWVESESPLSYVAGPAVSMVDLAVNPDRLDYYMKSNNLPQKQQLADCYNGGHPARTVGSIAGGAGGFVIGTSSARDLGARAIGVGGVSGAAGSGIGAGIGTLGGCAVGIVSGLLP
jgi:RHS repeat-associated protein